MAGAANRVCDVLILVQPTQKLKQTTVSKMVLSVRDDAPDLEKLEAIATVGFGLVQGNVRLTQQLLDRHAWLRDADCDTRA